MPKQLLELLVLMSESATTAKLTVFVIVKRPALSRPVLLVILFLLNSVLLLLASWVFVSTVLPESAGAGFHPIITRFTLLLHVCLLIWHVVPGRRRVS